MRRRWPDILGITGIKPPLRVFFKKNKPARKWNPNSGCSAANHWSKQFLKKFEGTQPCPAKKSSNYFLDSHQRKPRLFSTAQNGAESTVLGFEKKPKSKAINLKYHIRFLKPVYHRKTRIRQKNREIQGTQPCPAEKNS